MNKTMLLLVFFIFLATSCAPSGGAQGDAAGDAASLVDAGQTERPPGDSGAADDAANPVDAGASTPDAAHQIIATCSEIDATDCFANMDCAAEQRCQNMGDDVNFVPCCVPGQRGPDPAGSPCSMSDGELTCASGLCIDGRNGTLCSGTCDDVSDCPDNMQLCQFIAYSNSSEQWCFPQ